MKLLVLSNRTGPGDQALAPLFDGPCARCQAGCDVVCGFCAPAVPFCADHGIAHAVSLHGGDSWWLEQHVKVRRGR